MPQILQHLGLMGDRLAFASKMDLIQQKFGASEKISSQEEKAARKGLMTESQIQIDHLYDTAKIFNRENSCQSQIPVDVLCSNELNISYSVRKMYPKTFTEAKISMALYKRWVDLKNGKSREFKKIEQEEPEEETPEDFDLDQIQADLQDKSKPLELSNPAMIRYIIEDSVKKHFNSMMISKFKFALEK